MRVLMLKNKSKITWLTLKGGYALIGVVWVALYCVATVILYLCVRRYNWNPESKQRQVSLKYIAVNSKSVRKKCLMLFGNHPECAKEDSNQHSPCEGFPVNFFQAPKWHE